MIVEVLVIIAVQINGITGLLSIFLLCQFSSTTTSWPCVDGLKATTTTSMKMINMNKVCFKLSVALLFSITNNLLFFTYTCSPNQCNHLFTFSISTLPILFNNEKLAMCRWLKSRHNDVDWMKMINVMKVCFKLSVAFVALYHKNLYFFLTYTRSPNQWNN
jgi:hypothetical protein